jgi:hypothetical protein
VAAIPSGLSPTPLKKIIISPEIENLRADGLLIISPKIGDTTICARVGIVTFPLHSDLKYLPENFEFIFIIGLFISAFSIG